LTGRIPGRPEITRFRRYLELLVAWNRTHRLTGAKTPGDIVRELFQDSLLFLKTLPAGRLKMVDIGTGAGIPGVPLLIVRPDDISLTMIESRRKCVSFLSALKRQLDLVDLRIVEGRAEQLVGQVAGLAEAFDVVVTRGVGITLLPSAMRYLRHDGLFIAGGTQPEKNAVLPAEACLVKSETISFQELGLSRTFLMGRKQA
jgi:16S rRNA (guanine527-N7)-methyltransferase